MWRNIKCSGVKLEKKLVDMSWDAPHEASGGVTKHRDMHRNIYVPLSKQQCKYHKNIQYLITLVSLGALNPETVSFLKTYTHYLLYTRIQSHKMTSVSVTDPLSTVSRLRRTTSVNKKLHLSPRTYGPLNSHLRFFLIVSVLVVKNLMQDHVQL